MGAARHFDEPKMGLCMLNTEILTLSLLLNFYERVMNNWIINLLFGTHASPFTIVSGSQVHQDVSLCPFLFVALLSFALSGLKFANQPQY